VSQAYQELATILLNYHTGRIVLGSMCVGVSVWLGWSGIRVAGLSGACDYSVELPQRHGGRGVGMGKSKSNQIFVRGNYAGDLRLGLERIINCILK